MNLINKRRLDRLEERQGIGRTVQPVFGFVNNPDDPANAERLAVAERWQRDNPDGLVIERLIVKPAPGCSLPSAVSDETVH